MNSHDVTASAGNDFMGTAEAAEHLGVSVRTIHRIVARGGLVPLSKLPGSTGAYLFAAADVQRFAAERAA